LKKIIAKQHEMAAQVKPRATIINYSEVWSAEEKLLLLHGLKHIGRGKWQEISEKFLRTR